MFYGLPMAILSYCSQKNQRTPGPLPDTCQTLNKYVCDNELSTSWPLWAPTSPPTLSNLKGKWVSSAMACEDKIKTVSDSAPRSAPCPPGAEQNSCSPAIMSTQVQLCLSFPTSKNEIRWALPSSYLASCFKTLILRYSRKINEGNSLLLSVPPALGRKQNCIFKHPWDLGNYIRQGLKLLKLGSSQ